jgi:hypothetical protein
MVAMVAAMAIVPATADEEAKLVIGSATAPVKTAIVTVGGIQVFEVGFWDNAATMEIRTVGGTAGKTATAWAFSPVGLEIVSGAQSATPITQVGNALASDDDFLDEHGLGGIGTGALRTGAWAGIFAFSKEVADGLTFFRAAITGGPGVVRFYGKTGVDTLREFEVFLTNEAEVVTTTEEETTTIETTSRTTRPPTITTPRPAGGTIDFGGHPGARGTTAITTGTPGAGGAPKGGVALAIIPTIIAAGAAIVASKKKRK